MAKCQLWENQWDIKPMKEKVLQNKNPQIDNIKMTQCSGRMHDISKQWGMYLFNRILVHWRLLMLFLKLHSLPVYFPQKIRCKLNFGRHPSKIKLVRFCSRKTDNCQVDAVSRTNCKKCRLKKCLAIGMKPEKVTVVDHCWALAKGKQGCDA